MARISVILATAIVTSNAAKGSAFAQFMPPFIPLNGLFATSAVRHEIRKYRLECKRRSALGLNAESKENPEVIPASDIDLEHAKDCAEHFGKCSIEDMEEMRNKLHSERLKNFLTGNVGVRNPAGPEEELGRRLLEEDLSLQLSLLKHEMPASTLFEEPSEPMMKVSPGGAVSLNEKREVAAPNFSFAASSGAAEAVMICAAIALIALAPQLLEI